MPDENKAPWLRGLPDRWEADYWRLMATQKTWLPWWGGWQPWPLIWLGHDEYMRHTLVIGPVVFPLWRCRGKECREDYAALRGYVDEPLD